ncbi:hypothetical protein AB0J38_25725 [Streptomyces sp. NPDC050095]|uniref:hypothetical protein n=1 Tax=unclassified Streptomyces TaxID=2593676 RepID=UPI003426A1E6
MSNGREPNRAEGPRTKGPTFSAGDVAELIPILVPPSSKLTEDELCGRCCTWCGEPLRGRSSVNLGERDDELGRRIFPRACAGCTVMTVYNQLINHVSSCEQCVDNAAFCPESGEMRRAWAEGRRL